MTKLKDLRETAAVYGTSGMNDLSLATMMGYKGEGAEMYSSAWATNILQMAARISRIRESQNNNQITRSADSFSYMGYKFVGLGIEEFHVLYLNRSNRVITNRFISRGGISGTVVDMRVIFETAVKVKASSVILFHNHPSGSLRPSQADIDLTRKIREGGKILDIQVIDHLICYENTYFSFADEGLI